MKRALLSLLVLLLAVTAAPAKADFNEAPGVADPALDLGDVYVLRSPTNANNTVLAFTVQPFAGALSGTTFTQGARYDLKIDRTADYRADLTLRATFGPADDTGTQPYVLRCLPRAICPNRGLLARGRTGQNLPGFGGGQTRAGLRDNPLFFDRAAWDSFADDGSGTFPRAIGAAKNYYGVNGNVLAVVVELPSRRLAPTNAIVAVWARLWSGGAQADREGRPFTATGLIPRLPRNGAGTDRRDAFNAGRPADDVATFKAGVTAVLDDFWTPANVSTIAGLWLPDVLLFQIGNANGYGTFLSPVSGPFEGTLVGNGRRPRDDAYDFNLTYFTNGAITTDNVADDNGTRITDGNAGSIAAFPYLGGPNLPLNGPGTTPPP